MPHLVILYTPPLQDECDLDALCRRLADAMLAVRDEEGKPVFPVGGVRVLAYAAAHHAVADGSGDDLFCYLELRVGRGRSAEVHRRTGESLVAVTREHLAPVLARRAIGLTLKIEESQPLFEARFGTLHARFAARG